MENIDKWMLAENTKIKDNEKSISEKMVYYVL